ncbi:hypothetical protein IWQ52_002079 [Labrenzia sp. EL_159]|nr:hypothetical protein [Labrenzia sp. EL_162]MBG6194565.1 hypothetical protein [Labrenzia sp. EL_159]
MLHASQKSAQVCLDWSNTGNICAPGPDREYCLHILFF